MDVSPKTRLLILQATPFCNLNCGYCYLSLSERSANVRMEYGVVEKSIQFLVRNNLLGDRLTVLWHAGEPLTIPVGYYRDAIKQIRNLLPNEMKVDFNFQTNATLVTDEWCDLFVDEPFSIGVSIDGPKEVHDGYRVSRTGRGSFESAMNGIAHLRERKIPFGTISVVTDKSLEQAREIIEFLSNLDPVSIGFNIDEAEDTVSGARFSERLVESSSLCQSFTVGSKKMTKQVSAVKSETSWSV